MEEFLLVVALIVLFVRWLILSNRIARIERRIEDVSAHSNDAEIIAGMMQRIRALEQQVNDLSVKPPAAPDVLYSTPPPPLPEVEIVAATPPPIPKSRPAETIPEATPPPLPKPSFAFVAPEPAGPTFSERVREKMSGEEWEAIVGGSWLNKVGVLLSVIGLALLLGYSYTQKFGAAGRAATGLGVSGAMLAGGIVFERRARYTTFARGLLGGGWAALYFTTYAMQAVDATKVIDDPIVGGVLLLAVATGMIVHSLRYRSQTVTGLAYFVAFVTLAITPATTLSVVALVPLAASLLYVAQRFSWSQMALLGLVATYGTCASRGSSGAPLWQAQSVFTIYWLLFEAFDLLRASRRTNYNAWDRAILPLNALAFTGLSYAAWSAAAPAQLGLLAAAIAAAYLASTVLRTWLRPPSSFAPETQTLDRALSGGYEGPITITAILSVAAILLKFHGTPAQLGLLAEAQVLFLAGLLFRESYPRQLAAAVFAGSAGKLLLADVPSGGSVNIAGWIAKAWTPVAAVMTLLFYINRALRTADKFYGYAGSGAVALILGFETPERYLGLSWFALAAVLFSLGWLKRLQDFRVQSYLLSALGLSGIATYQAKVIEGLAPPFKHPWITLGISAMLCYAGAFCGLRSAQDRLSEWEQKGLKRAGSWSATILLVVLAWRMLPGGYLGLGWLAIAILLLEAGLRALPADFRPQAYAVAVMGSLRVFLFNVLPVNNDGPLRERLIIASASVLAYVIAARIFRDRLIPPRERIRVFNVSSATGTLFLLIGLWALLPAVVVGPAWATAALVLIEIGFAADIPGLRLQGHLAGAAALGRVFFANFTGMGRVGWISHRVLTVVPVVVSHYYQWSKQRTEELRLWNWERHLGRVYLYSAAAMGVMLLRFELGRVLTVTGWAALAVGLLVCGTRWNNLDFKLQSYIIAALTFWRAWTTNFYAPESFAGVAGRIATGGFVIACFYAAHLIAPRVERYARLYFSMLATVLLTVLLFYEVSGSLLTVCWGVEGVVLLIAGFPLNDRVFRLSGLTLFLLCIMKLFMYDLRHLETMYRILSFITLGLILVGVSWIYTRFREKIQRFL